MERRANLERQQQIEREQAAARRAKQEEKRRQEEEAARAPKHSTKEELTTFGPFGAFKNFPSFPAGVLDSQAALTSGIVTRPEVN